MGFSVAAASGIIGISILVIIELSVGTIFPTIQDVSESYSEMKNRALEQLQTDINILSVNASINGTNHDLIITLQNAGSITIDLLKCHVLINGSTFQFQSSNDYIHPQKQTNLTLNQLPGLGTRRVKVISEQGIADYYTYATP